MPMQQNQHSMKFNLLIKEGPYTHQASDSAYQFVKAALTLGHEVVRVFFYHDGVYNASRLNSPPVDDRNVTSRWVKLAEKHDLDLVICIAAALRRGILDQDSARRYGKDVDNIDSRFTVAGVGYFIEGSIIADRTLVFGD